jgi:hypothetical protein
LGNVSIFALKLYEADLLPILFEVDYAYLLGCCEGYKAKCIPNLSNGALIADFVEQFHLK